MGRIHARRLLVRITSIAIGIVFIISAFLKLFPVEIFEFSIAETGLMSWTLASYAARILIGIEFLAGLLLVAGFFPRIVIPSTLFLLLLFSGYLIWIMTGPQSHENCNCFGIYMIVSPTESLIKNFGMAGLLVFIWFYSAKQKNTRLKSAVTAALIIVSLIFPFFLNPVPVYHAGEFGEGKPIDLQPVMQIVHQKYPEIELDSGKHLVFFASAGCRHCISAAYKIQIIQGRIPELSVFFFLNGKTNKVETFHQLTSTTHIPYVILPFDIMIRYTAGKLPLILLINNSIVEGNPNYYEMNETLILEWMNKSD